jgi:CRISPR-associated endonuclease/helicase Cas3
MKHLFYAKSNPVETIREHTDQLLSRYMELYDLNRNKYPYMSETDWNLLKLAVQYHDIGKADAVFQNKIRKAISQPLIEEKSSHIVQHNYLSVLTIPYRKLNFSDEDCYLLAQVVGYHHERDCLPDKKLLIENFKENILPITQEIEDHLNVNLPKKSKNLSIDWLQKENRIRPSADHFFFRYVMIKGLLHRLDHAASAHVPIEMATDYFVVDYVNRFIDKKFAGKKRELQRFTEKQQDKHVIAIAQTGMGKTEASLLWIGKDKGFLTLPLRVSINAMYRRIRDEKDGIGFTSKREKPNQEEQAIGLLHSTSMDYLYDVSEEMGDSESNLEVVYAQSRQFANKLIISTVDQILKFPFFYRGFEKELATLAGAKVVIDELQAYDPKIAALIIRALELIDIVGGKFMILTATMPDFYLKALESLLEDSRTPVVKGEFFDDDVKRHHIQLHSDPILDSAEDIAIAGESEKVLVICNTVKKAKELYHSVQQCSGEGFVKLLHSMFTRQDRAEKEVEILKFTSSEDEMANKSGIWITTQLVEASLDIDFDKLFTEMSTLDSQFQRFGRCNRKGLKPVQNANVHIFTEEISGIGDNSVYHPEIFDRSLQIINGTKDRILLESEKMKMIEQLYDDKELEGTKFKEEFIQTLRELKGRPPYEIDSQNAQKLLRNIRQVQVIPQEVFENNEVLDLIEQYEKSKDKNERRKLRRNIEKSTVGVNEFLAKNKGLLTKAGIPDSLKELYVIECEYSTETGIELDKEIDPFI